MCPMCLDTGIGMMENIYYYTKLYKDIQTYTKIYHIDTLQFTEGFTKLVILLLQGHLAE